MLDLIYLAAGVAVLALFGVYAALLRVLFRSMPSRSVLGAT